MVYFNNLSCYHNRVNVVGKNSFRVVAFCDDLMKTIDYFVYVAINHVRYENVQNIELDFHLVRAGVDDW